MTKGRRRPESSNSSSSDSYSNQSSGSSVSTSSSSHKKQKQNSSRSKKCCESAKQEKHSRGTETAGASSSHPASDAAHARLPAVGMYGVSHGQTYATGTVMGFGSYQGSVWPSAAPPMFSPHGLPSGPPPPRPLPPGFMLPPHLLSSGPPPPRPLPPGAAFPRPPGLGHGLPPASRESRDPRAANGSNDFHRPDDRSRPMDLGPLASRDRPRNNKRDKPKWVPGQGRNPDLDAERKTGFGLASAWSEHDDRRAEGDMKRKRAPSPSGSWKHDLFDEVMKSDAKDSKAKKRR